MKLLLAFLAMAALSAAPMYRLVDLAEVSGSPVVRTFDINDSGEITGEVFLGWGPGGGLRAFLYSGGSLTLIESPSGDNWTVGYAINAHGEIVGEDYSARRGLGFRYKGGRVETIGEASGGMSGEAFGLNDHGDVVGVFDDGPGQSAYLYSDGVLTDIGALLPPGPAAGWELSAATGINNAGMVIVNYAWVPSDSPFPVERAFAYSELTGVIDLGTLFPDGHISSVGAINESGEIVGRSCAGLFYEMCTAFLISEGKLTPLPAIASNPSGSYLAWDLNDIGSILGSFRDGASRSRPVVWTEGTAHDLATLVRGAADWELLDAYAINNKNQIVGVGSYRGEYRGFLLNPIDETGVPEPSTFVPLGVAVSVLLLRRQLIRRR